MRPREEFLHILADGLVSTEYSDRFLQEMSDHLDDAEQLYALKENGNDSEQKALHDIGDPKYSQKLFNHVMKYRNKISVLTEVLLLCILAVAISNTSEIFMAFRLGGTLWSALFGFGGMVATIAVFMVISLRRIQRVTFGELRLAIPAAAFVLAILIPSVLNWFMTAAMQVDASTLSLVIETTGASVASKLIGALIGYLLARTAPWERLLQWKRWSDYRSKHTLPFNGWWLLSVYVVLSTCAVWVGERVYTVAYGPLLQILFLWPRHAIEQFVFGIVVIHSSLLVYGSAVILALLGILFTALIFSSRRKKEPVSPIHCAAIVYILCLLLGSPLLPAEPAKGIEWQVPVENIEQTQLHKQFGVLDRFASYVNSFHEPVVYAVRYQPTSHELVIATDHPHQVMAITAIQNVHTYINVPAENQKRFAGYAEEKTFPKGFSCDVITSNALTASPSDGSYCSTVYYQHKKIFVVPQGRFVYIDHIATDESGKFALILMRNDIERMVNNHVYLIELPVVE